MAKYVAQRILLMLMTLFIITLMCFVLIRMLPPAPLPPGDPHSQIVEVRREALGYGKPYLVQFGIYMKDIFTKFDFGDCCRKPMVNTSKYSYRNSIRRMGSS